MIHAQAQSFLNHHRSGGPSGMSTLFITQITENGFEVARWYERWLFFFFHSRDLKLLKLVPTTVNKIKKNKNGRCRFPKLYKSQSISPLWWIFGCFSVEIFSYFYNEKLTLKVSISSVELCFFNMGEKTTFFHRV